jgi:hypothetical protein
VTRNLPRKRYLKPFHASADVYLDEVDYSRGGVTQIQIGSTVLARLHDGREVIAKITAIVDSVVGRKVITFGAFTLNVDGTQIVRDAT